MSYSNKVSYYRQCIDECVKEEDLHGVKMNLIAYANVMREMAKELKSYSDRVYIKRIAERYDLMAAYVTKEGLSQRVREAIRNQGEGLSIPTAKVAQPTTEVPRAQTVKAATISDTTSEPVVDAPGDRGEEWVADMFEKYVASAVEVHTEYAEGTGFFINEHGYLLTNHHVVYTNSKRNLRIRIVSCDKDLNGDVEFIAADEKKDVALLRFKNARKKTPYIPLIEDFKEVRAGIDVMLIGNGLGFGLAPILGTIKFPHKRYDGSLVYTAMTNGGDSGSPLINRQGKCVAIHKARENERGRASARGIAYATAMDDVVKLLKNWKQKFDLPI